MSTKKSNFLSEKINIEYENSFSNVALISKEIGSEFDCLVASRRVLSYNPNKSIIFKLFPQYEVPISIIGNTVNELSLELKKLNGNSELWTILGFCYLLLGDFPNSFAAFAHVLRIRHDSNYICLFYCLGIVYARYGYYDSSILWFLKCFQQDNTPKELFSDIFFRLGILYRQINQNEKSLQNFQEILENPPFWLKKTDIQLQIGYQYLLLSKYQQSYSIFKDLYLNNLTNINFIRQFCTFLYLESSQIGYDKFKNDFSEIFKLNKLDPYLQLIEARNSFKLNNLQKSLLLHKSSMSYWTHSNLYWLSYGNLLFLNNQYEDSIQFYQRSIFYDEDFLDSYLNLGFIFEYINDYKNALKIYKQGLQKNSNSDELKERINKINNLNQNLKNKNLIKDIDERKLFIYYSNQFSTNFLNAIPYLPNICFQNFKSLNNLPNLSTYPNSSN